MGFKDEACKVYSVEFSIGETEKSMDFGRRGAVRFKTTTAQMRVELNSS
jgi:hypothetical protein